MAVDVRHDARVRRVPVSEPPPDELPGYDYADAFELTMSHDEKRSAEDLVRLALEETPRALREVVWFVWQAALRFEVGPRSSPEHVVGARVTTREPDLVHLHVAGPLMSGVIAGRRTASDRFLVTTFLHYERPVAANAVWSVVSPLHRAIARYLLLRAGGRV